MPGRVSPFPQFASSFSSSLASPLSPRVCARLAPCASRSPSPPLSSARLSDSPPSPLLLSPPPPPVPVPVPRARPGEGSGDGRRHRPTLPPDPLPPAGAPRVLRGRRPAIPPHLPSSPSPTRLALARHSARGTRAQTFLSPLHRPPSPPPSHATRGSIPPPRRPQPTANSLTLALSPSREKNTAPQAGAGSLGGRFHSNDRRQEGAPARVGPSSPSPPAPLFLSLSLLPRLLPRPLRPPAAAAWESGACGEGRGDGGRRRNGEAGGRNRRGRGGKGNGEAGKGPAAGEAGGRGAAPRASPSRFPLRPAAGARETGAKGGEGRKKSLERGGEVTVVVIVVVIVI